jgi:hypothetical protein
MKANQFEERGGDQQEKSAAEGEYRLRPEIRLEIFRHDRAAGAAPGMTDQERRLTPEGRVKATQKGKEKAPDSQMGIAYGSPRERAQETALRQLLANEAIAGDETTLDELKASIKKALPFGNKLVISDKLDYATSKPDPAYTEAYNKNYNKGELLSFMLNESDDLVRKQMDANDYSYSRIASNIAAIVKKYAGIMPTWERIYDKKQYGDANEMQRFVGTHQAIPEIFLLKVIEKTEGKKAAAQFLEELPDKNGGGFSEGISVIIRMEQAKPEIAIRYGNKEFMIDEGVLDEILADAEDLNEATGVIKKKS